MNKRKLSSILFFIAGICFISLAMEVNQFIFYLLGGSCFGFAFLQTKKK